MPALSGGMKSRWSSILGDQVEIQDRVAFFTGLPAKGREAAPKMAD